MIRVLVADDHALFRRGVGQVVGGEPDMAIVGEAADAQELLALARGQHCDVIVLDISMPGRSGLDALEEIRKERPTLPVVVLTVHPEDQYAVRALKKGAAGYLTKEAVPEELVAAIRKVVSGGKYLIGSVAERLAFRVATDHERPLHEGLSDREYHVMSLIASGRSVSEIAGELSLSVKTVSTYRARVLRKMNMKTNAELIRYAVHNQLVI